MRIPQTERWRNEAVELFVLELSGVSDDYVGWLADPEVNRFLETRHASPSRTDVEDFVRGLLESETDILFGIMDLRLGRHVGNLRLGPIDRHHRRAEVGIMIGDRESWGRGIASSALSLLGPIAREELQLRKLTAGCYGANGGSRRAFEKAGFEVEGVRRAHLLHDGEPDDLVLMGQQVGG